MSRYTDSGKAPSTWTRLLKLNGLVLLTVASCFNVAYAHKVNMFAYAEGKNIFVEGYFADGRKAQNSTVQVYNTKGTELLHGTTDDLGQYTFPIPQKSDLRIVLNAGMGHQTEYLIAATELPSLEETPAPSTDTANKAAANTAKTLAPAAAVKPVRAADQTDPGAPALSEAEIQLMIERAVGQSIQPVMRSLSEMREEKALSTIVGGIGYIVGIMGVFFYLKARKQQQSAGGEIKSSR